MRAIRTENIISPLVRIDAFTAVDSFNPKKYATKPETSANPIRVIMIRFFLPILRIGSESFLIGVKNAPLIK